MMKVGIDPKRSSWLVFTGPVEGLHYRYFRYPRPAGGIAARDDLRKRKQWP